MKKSWITSMLCLLLLFCAAGCRSSLPAASDPPSDESGDSRIAKVEAIESGVFSEITENNFQEGIEHTFTTQELSVWKTVLREISDTSWQPDTAPQPPAYLVSLYDADGGLLFEFSFDDALVMYNVDGNSLSQADIVDMLSGIIAE